MNIKNDAAGITEFDIEMYHD